MPEPRRPADPDPGHTRPGGPEALKPAGLGRRQRLLSANLFEEAYSQGRKYVGRWMVLWLRSGTDAALRLGVVSGRKVGGAVQRNRARRRLRTLFRKARNGLQGRFDVVIVARAGIDTVEWKRLERDFEEVMRRTGLRRDDQAASNPVERSGDKS